MTRMVEMQRRGEERRGRGREKREIERQRGRENESKREERKQKRERIISTSKREVGKRGEKEKLEDRR
jgi:hypothetical protein